MNRFCFLCKVTFFVVLREERKRKWKKVLKELKEKDVEYEKMLQKQKKRIEDDDDKKNTKYMVDKETVGLLCAGSLSGYTTYSSPVSLSNDLKKTSISNNINAISKAEKGDSILSSYRSIQSPSPLSYYSSSDPLVGRCYSPDANLFSHGCNNAKQTSLFFVDVWLTTNCFVESALNEGENGWEVFSFYFFAFFLIFLFFTDKFAKLFIAHSLIWRVQCMTRHHRWRYYLVIF
jgi:hypothetical protein